MAAVLTNEQVSDFFRKAPVRIAGNANLRVPQVEGHEAARVFFDDGGHRAVEQIPVGCGKTGLITLLPFGIARGRVLVIAPNLTIKRQLRDAFDITSQECFYRKVGVLADLANGPFVAALDADANLSDCDDAHVVVTNIQQLGEHADRWLPEFEDGFFDLIVVDEGHHNAAPSWQRVFERFPEARVLSVTATPFRADEQPVEGEVIYRYPFRDAMHRGYIKDITSVNVAPREIYFTYRGDDHHHTLDEVLELREEDWFSRGVALAHECNVSIADASILWLQYLRETGTPHQLIAVACSMDHARDVRSIYQERGLETREIHSGMPEYEREDILRDLRNGRIDAVVQVQMLGEGFDHPPLSVAAIFRPFRSLSPYIQFVGRIMRVYVQNAPGHPDNQGIVVSHVGMNVDRHWDDFKQIDQDDQELVAGWLEAGDEVPPTGERASRRRIRPDMDVTMEVIDRFISDPYLDPSDDTLIDNALTVMREQGLDLATLGLDREELRRRIVAARAHAGPREPMRLPVQPQAHRQTLRLRLREQTQSAAARICEALGQRIGGRQIAALGGTGAANNLGAVAVYMNRAINDFLGIDSGQRRELSTEELERVVPNVDELADGVEADLRTRLAE
jgi:superfamily II DNA or RNA helicase